MEFALMQIVMEKEVSEKIKMGNFTKLTQLSSIVQMPKVRLDIFQAIGRMKM